MTDAHHRLKQKTVNSLLKSGTEEKLSPLRNTTGKKHCCSVVLHFLLLKRSKQKQHHKPELNTCQTNFKIFIAEYAPEFLKEWHSRIANWGDASFFILGKTLDCDKN